MEPRANAGESYGGHADKYHKPWKLQYGEKWSEKRPIKIHSHVWGLKDGGNGHHHAEIRESDNKIWLDEGQGSWGRPWEFDEDPIFKELLGRRSDKDDLIKAANVKKWALGILSAWGVTDKTHEIKWDIADDDPYTNATLAREMRKRYMQGD